MFYGNNYQQPINSFGYNQMQQYNPSIQTQGLKGRPVSSLEEVRAAQIDFDGSLFVFPDIANKKIYTKQINLDGTAAVRIYGLVNDSPPAPAYITKEELDSAIVNLKKELTEIKVKENSNEPTIRTTNTKPAISF